MKGFFFISGVFLSYQALSSAIIGLILNFSGLGKDVKMLSEIN